MSGAGKRLSSLDALRGLAAGAVFLQHLLEAVAPAASAPFLALGPGVFGVVLFFGISGFVMPYSVGPRVELHAYVIRRVARIYPAYLAAVALAALVAFTLAPAGRAAFTHAYGGGLVWNLLFLQELAHVPAILGVTWTLSLEFVWYAVFAIAAFGLGRTRVITVQRVYSLALACVAIASLVLDTRVPFGRLAMLGAALTGSVVALGELHELRSRVVVQACTEFTLACALGLWVAFGCHTHPGMSLATVSSAWAGAGLAFGGAVLGAGRLRLDDRAFGRALVRLGLVSYSLYLVHGPVIAALRSHLSGWGLAAGTVIGTCVLTELLHRGVEQRATRPLVQFLERWWSALVLRFSQPTLGREG